MAIANFVSRTAKALGFLQEKKAYPLSDPAISDFFGVAPTMSGVNVSGHAALYVPAVLQAVRLISETIGSLPCKLYEETEAGKEAAKDHSAHKIVHSRANEWTGAGELRAVLTADAVLRGGGFARVIRFPDGRPFEVVRIKPEKVMILEDEISGAPVYRVSEATGTRDHHFTEILHIPCFLGRSPISYGKEAIGLASILERHGAQFFGSGARPSGIITNEKPQGSEAGATTVANIKKSFRLWQTSANGDPLIMDAGWKYEQPAMASTDAQFLENRIEQINEIARIFGVPPHMLYQLDRATWSNAEQMAASFLQLCLRPWLDRWQDAYATVLLTEEERDSHYFEFVIDDLQRADSAARAEIFSKLIAARVMTPNEVRAAMNMPPLPGGDQLSNPYTTTSQPARHEPPKEAA
ncbi:phage portal protein [Pseudorhizobium endolithicum]|uniref:Phage portal protein n=1 Tax=Pseudorhizobium endolithicum TaxID=1191678 RepID=A0ABM8PF87_9HYPH|nr:phage portal protein [Pseudorhizobium endolithicum]CAD7026599.1 phage portal protein [Pseudorhizobium endolithicum]